MCTLDSWKGLSWKGPEKSSNSNPCYGQGHLQGQPQLLWTNLTGKNFFLIPNLNHPCFPGGRCMGRQRVGKTVKIKGWWMTCAVAERKKLYIRIRKVGASCFTLACEIRKTPDTALLREAKGWKWDIKPGTKQARGEPLVSHGNVDLQEDESLGQELC